RLLINVHDDGAFERVVNLPPRGIGPRTIDLLREQARAEGGSLWSAARAVVQANALPPRALGAVRGFVALIEQLQTRAQGEPGGNTAADPADLGALIQEVVEATGLPAHYKKERDGRGVDRIENLEQLAEATRRFAAEAADDEGDLLGSFLAHAALEAGDAQADDIQDAVQLMTLHSAKGLEFPVVFVTGVEEGLFPHAMSADDPARLEEERRLCYVGMTRAMQRLYLTHTESRRLHGREEYPMPSRFLREMPGELLEEVRGSGVSQPYAGGKRGAQPAAAGGFRLGQQVVHPKFGSGVVLGTEGSGNQARIQVNFETVGAKWLVLAYARLDAVG
ncbi:MAG: ATP-binding domain-containing protein, partial [Thiohalocapsa sp.]|uniref:3'-5' exonuclease n=1 Tax=Thiohalocapsa sp. TaxID=2497641 RepID=UPI0025DD6F80